MPITIVLTVVYCQHPFTKVSAHDVLVVKYFKYHVNLLQKKTSVIKIQWCNACKTQKVSVYVNGNNGVDDGAGDD